MNNINQAQTLGGLSCPIMEAGSEGVCRIGVRNVIANICMAITMYIRKTAFGYVSTLGTVSGL